MIEIINVTKKYSEIEVLSNINLSIKKGKIFGIVGYSGAGKSTLLRLINSLEEVSNGSILIDNSKDITKLKGKALREERRKIGMIFQGFNLLTSKTVYENIAFPLRIKKINKQEIDKKVKEIISLVNLEGKEKFYPRALSGGQKQRVGIARALVNSPNILLCDEATSALDPSNTHSILDLLKTIQKKTGITIVLITHEMEVIKEVCDEVAVLDKGSIVEQGKVNDIFSNPKHLTTKEFVVKGYYRNKEIDYNKDILQKIESGKFLKINYNTQNVNKAIISNISTKFNLEVNILEAFIKKDTENAGYSQIIAHIDTNDSLLNEVIDYLKTQNVEVEIIDNA